MTQTVTLGGSANLSGFRFRSASISEGLSSISTASVIVVSDDGADFPESSLGKTLSITWPLAKGNGQRHFNGVIGRYSLQSLQDGGRASYCLTLYSWNWLLTKNATFRIFQNKSIPDILSEIFGKYTHPSVRVESRLKANYDSWEYCVQYRETDFNFVSRLMEQLGIYYYFEHTAKGHSLVLSDGKGHDTFPSYDSLPFAPTAGSGRSLEQEHNANLNFFKEIRTHNFGGADYWFKNPKNKTQFTASGPGPDFVKEFEFFDYPLEVDDPDEGARIVKIRAEELSSTAKQIEGTSNCGALSAGYLVKVTDHDLQEFKPELLITAVNVQIHESDSQSGGDNDTSLLLNFTAIPSSQPFRPPRITPKPYVYGPQSGLVVGRKGDEITTDEFGRVKVHFYWDRESQQNENSSCWIRVASPFAGKGWGFIAIPRIGDEVLVHFEDGDPDRPIIVGSLYNKDQVTPYPLEGEENCVGLRSRSTKGAGPDNFNEIRFDDTKGKEYVWLQAEKDFNTLVKNIRSENVLSDNNLHIGGDSKSLIDGSHHVEVGKDLMSVVQGDAHFTVSQDLIAKIASLLSAAVEGSAVLSVSNDLAVKSGTNLDIKSGSDSNLTSGSAINLNGSTHINLQAGVKISLSVGGSFISISPSGIDIKGPLVNVNSGGSASKAKKAKPAAPKAPTKSQQPKDPKDPIKGR